MNAHKKNRKIVENIPQHAMSRNLELRKSTHVHDFLKNACAKSIFKHILFSRGIIPCPVDEILKTVEEKVDCADSRRTGRSETNVAHTAGRSRKRERSRMSQERKCIRKYEKHGEQIRSVLEAFDALFGETETKRTYSGGGDEDQSKAITFSTARRATSVRCKAILITIGPSFSSPREQYLIRFHSAENGCQSVANSRCKSSPSLPPLQVQQRLAKEMGIRSIRELICGTLEEDYSEMFENKVGMVGGSGSTCTKVSVACLVSDDQVQRLLLHSRIHGKGGRSADEPKEDDMGNNDGVCERNSEQGNRNGSHQIAAKNYDPNDIAQLLHQGGFGGGRRRTSASTLLFTADHRFQVREPRMYSKRKGLHRPFAVLNVIPSLASTIPSTPHTLRSKKHDKIVTLGVGVPRFEQPDKDVWISFRPFVRAFQM